MAQRSVVEPLVERWVPPGVLKWSMGRMASPHGPGLALVRSCTLARILQQVWGFTAGDQGSRSGFNQ